MKNTYLPFFAQGSLVSNLSSDDDTSLESIKRYLRNDEFRYVIVNKKELTEIFDKLENEVNSLSEKIDSINSKTEIEVKLLSSID